MRPLEAMSKRLLKAVIVVEMLGVFGAYGLFQAMNSSREFRNKMNQCVPSVLEVYYQSNEWAGIYGIRERDRHEWSKQN